MSSVFVDTSFLIALLRKRDENHHRAAAWQNALPETVVTTECILIELLDSLASPLLRLAAASTVNLLRTRQVVRVELFAEGLRLYKNYQDKSWSLTDCMSFVVMRREGITDALTADRDFEQAVFRALLRSAP